MEVSFYCGAPSPFPSSLFISFVAFFSFLLLLRRIKFPFLDCRKPKRGITLVETTHKQYINISQIKNKKNGILLKDISILPAP